MTVGRGSTTREMKFGVVDSDSVLLAPTRFVVVCPRALRCGQLIDLEADQQSHSVFAKLLKEAKVFFKAEKVMHTWIVFDGDLDASWCEKILYTVEDLQDDIPGHKKGLQLSSGKYLTIPEYVRIIMESTTLISASPSFISRVGAIHVSGYHRGMNINRWENIYEIWKKVHQAEFEGYAEAIFATLDTVVIETVSVCVQFVCSNFQSYWNGIHEMERVQWMLKLFHSALKQCWRKFCSLTSEKQRSTAIHCLFLQALVWGVGCTTYTLERQKFHLFLYDLIQRGPKSNQSTLKRVVALFFPSGTLMDNPSKVPTGDKTNQVFLYAYLASYY
ncbi:Dynein heavy chain [Phytophthora palmivora]|uniref:Dynein heavy chain n=1 Tax=Phytophthora palmivora TaxID=4796 RepID=A0A2P4XND0_9STRA|nr:Dynein heavy chain [Phytophthora palmivora]